MYILFLELHQLLPNPDNIFTTLNDGQCGKCGK